MESESRWKSKFGIVLWTCNACFWFDSKRAFTGFRRELVSVLIALITRKLPALPILFPIVIKQRLGCHDHLEIHSQIGCLINQRITSTWWNRRPSTFQGNSDEHNRNGWKIGMKLTSKSNFRAHIDYRKVLKLKLKRKVTVKTSAARCGSRQPRSFNLGRNG